MGNGRTTKSQPKTGRQYDLLVLDDRVNYKFEPTDAPEDVEFWVISEAVEVEHIEEEIDMTVKYDFAKDIGGDVAEEIREEKLARRAHWRRVLGPFSEFLNVIFLLEILLASAIFAIFSTPL